MSRRFHQERHLVSYGANRLGVVKATSLIREQGVLGGKEVDLRAGDRRASFIDNSPLNAQPSIAACAETGKKQEELKSSHVCQRFGR
jgi:hypothetical protein